jgi:hypothetical protein
VNDIDSAHTEHRAVDVVLEGGPADLPATARTRRAGADEYSIKVPHRGGYEHFERVPDTSAADRFAAVVYRWTARTRIAE